MSARVAGRRAAAGVLAAVGAAGCKANQAPALTANAVLPDSAEQVMYGLRLLQTSGGVRRSVLFADTGFFYNDGTLVDLRRVRLVFFSAAGDSNAVMVGRTGRYDTRTQRVEGRGDVVVTSTDGRRLTSPHLVYERAINQITSDTNFTFVEPGRTLEGVGFRSDPQLRNVQVLRGFRGRTTVEQTPGVRPLGGTPFGPARPPGATPGTPTPTPGAAPPASPPAAAGAPAGQPAPAPRPSPPPR